MAAAFAVLTLACVLQEVLTAPQGQDVDIARGEEPKGTEKNVVNLETEFLGSSTPQTSISSDEKTKDAMSNSPLQFRCLTAGQLVPLDSLCNGVDDCKDASDERFCSGKLVFAIASRPSTSNGASAPIGPPTSLEEKELLDEVSRQPLTIAAPFALVGTVTIVAIIAVKINALCTGRRK